MAIFKNGVVVDADATISRYVSVGTDVGAAGVSLITTAVKGDYFELWLTTNDGDEVTINSGTMIAKVIG
jgi:hypothetical protein